MKLLLIAAFSLLSLTANASAPESIAFERLAYEISSGSSDAQKLESSGFYIESLNRLGARPTRLADCITFALRGLADQDSCAPISARIIDDGGGTGGVD